jgi:YgiT-type zinc finger domain-containing protein
MIPYQRSLPKFTVCPECGEKTIERVNSDYLTEDGVIIERLERWQCSACRADFFDIEAMRRLVTEKRPSRTRKASSHYPMEKNHA